MLGIFRRKSSGRSAKTVHTVPAGTRVYAIGDIHGCKRQLEWLLDAIERDCSGNGMTNHVIFLGDLIDRGPDSRGVLQRLMDGPLPGQKHDFLMGNHEEAMLQVWEGHGDVVSGWLRFGGAQTMESYGITRGDMFRLGMDLPRLVQDIVPDEHICFMQSFKDHVAVGDYLFVHAGIRPGIPLSQQEASDLRWIRDEFLADEETDHGFKVVHGHTISDGPVLKSNRIGIDTGCYVSGTLTALVLEGSEHRFLAVGGESQRRDGLGASPVPSL